MEFSIVYLYIALIFIGAVINVVAWRRDLSRRKAVETLLFWCLVAGVGIAGITLFSTFLLFPGTLLDPSGWPGAGPFRWESGPAWLAVGLAGLACAKWRGGFWGATILMSSVIFLGDVAGRMTGDLWTNNAGAILSGPAFWYEIFLPVAMVILWLWLWSIRRDRNAWLKPLEREVS